MELELREGDYVPEGAANLRRLSGAEAVLQRALFRLTARRGAFPFWDNLGSRLWQLGQLSPSARQAAARQYVAEALTEEPGLSVENVALTELGGKGSLIVDLSWNGTPLSVSLEVP